LASVGGMRDKTPLADAQDAGCGADMGGCKEGGDEPRCKAEVYAASSASLRERLCCITSMSDRLLANGSDEDEELDSSACFAARFD
jgi:hypothetical protein